jgi:hypothetical protein
VSTAPGKTLLEVRAAKSNDTIARRAFVESHALRRSDPNIEVDLDRVGIVVSSPPVGSTPCLVPSAL